ncbi:MAG: hypothetical protein IPP80_03570 [Ignavibacteria bacterium]|nr:hypothetical protein [Ignavibacteria bacterium]
MIALLVQRTQRFLWSSSRSRPPSGKYLANELEAKQLDEQILGSVAKKGAPRSSSNY